MRRGRQLDAGVRAHGHVDRVVDLGQQWCECHFDVDVQQQHRLRCVGKLERCVGRQRHSIHGSLVRQRDVCPDLYRSRRHECAGQRDGQCAADRDARRFTAGGDGRQYQYLDLEFGECHELQRIGRLERRQVAERHASDRSALDQHHLHVDVHGRGWHQRAGQHFRRGGADRGADGESDHHRGGRHSGIELEFRERVDLHGVGRLERDQAGQRHAEHRRVIRSDHLHADL